MENYLIIDKNLTAVANAQMNNDTVKKLWNSFCLTLSKINFKTSEKFTFRLGTATTPILKSEKDYALTVDKNGVAIIGKDYPGLMRGFMSLLMKIEYDGTLLKIKYVTEESNYKFANRMIHICVFPENDLYYIKKLVRLAALCQYTHIVIEFWGMLKYDCLKELSWPHAFTKEQVKELCNECHNLGIEPVPMFNQLGHASASRMCFGKHVVLDQNPRLQNLFTLDGWAWNITSDEVFNLLKQVRTELYEVFGKGEYMHIGCDEAYYITNNESLRKELPNYLAKLTNEVVDEGRRPMLWMDMLLEERAFENCYTTGKKDEVHLLRSSCAKSTVFVDWQYDCTSTPIPSLISLKGCGYDAMGAPWYNPDNYNAHIKTIADNNMFGIMLTTWHTLKDHISTLLDCAKQSGAKSFVWDEYSGNYEKTATIWRRVSFEGNSYHDSGWAKKQIEA